MALKRRKLFFLTAGAIALLALPLFLSREREPTCDGKTLSEWIAQHFDEVRLNPANQEAAHAVRRIGTNALPYLFEWAGYESASSGPQKVFAGMLGRLPENLRPDFVETWTLDEYKINRSMQSIQAVAIFADQPQLCIPPFVQLLNETNKRIASARAAYGLALLGDSALPSLAAQLADTNAPNRKFVAFVLGAVTPLATNSSVPTMLLARSTRDPDPLVSVRAVRSLGSIGEVSSSYANLAVPALTNCLSSENFAFLRTSAVSALRSYSNHARIAVPLLLDLTRAPDSTLRLQVTNTLLVIAPETLVNPPGN